MISNHLKTLFGACEDNSYVFKYCQIFLKNQKKQTL